MGKPKKKAGILKHKDRTPSPIKLFWHKWKDQAALEFLITYGWTIIVVLVAVGALSYLGILSPGKTAPGECILDPGVACVGHKAENTASGNGRITISVQNSLGHSMTAVELKATDCGSGALTPIISNGDQATLTVDCINPLAGLKYKGQANITYINPETGLVHTINGILLTNIEGVSSAMPSSDTSPPIRSNDQPTGTLPAGTTNATLSLTTDENANCRYSNKTGTAYSAMASTFSVTGGTNHSTTAGGLSDGSPYSYYVRCQDSLGNANPNDFAITFSIASGDIIPPSTPAGLSAAAISSSRIGLSWSQSTDTGGSGLAGYKVYRSGTQIATTSLTAFSDAGLNPSTTYTYTVSAYDNAGNEGPKSSPASAKTLAGVDMTPPIISNGQPTGTLPAGTTQATLSAATDENANCRYSTAAGTAYSSMANTFSATGATSHSQAITGLSNGNSYDYYVRCQDGLGNANTNDFVISFSVAIVLQTCASKGGSICAANNVCPGTNLSASDTTSCCSTACTIPSWALCSQCGSGLFNICDRTECYSITETCYFVGFNTCNRCAAATCASYTDQTACSDDHCGLTCAWTGASCTSALDTTPPTISSVLSSSITSSGATITWTTNESSDTQIEYGTTISYGSSTVLNTAMSTSHSQPITGLTANTSYHYRVNSKDAAGNLATSGDFTFTTGASQALLFQTSFTPSQGWTSDRNQTGCGAGFAGIQSGIGDHGGWFPSGTCDTVETAANNLGGAGGRGFRHLRADGNDVNGGGIKVSFNTVPEVYIRWYQRWESGFNWAPAANPGWSKDIYINVGAASGWPIAVSGPQGNRWGVGIVSPGSRQYGFTTTKGWADIMNGPLGDGQWHCHEVHLKMDTNGANGVIQSWIDGTQAELETNINWGTTNGWTQVLFGSNQYNPSNGRNMAVDYDDIAIGATGPIGCLGGSPPPPPDTTPPALSNGAPTGILPAGTTSATLSLTTNENATCRYSTTANTAYALMNTFTTTGGTSHSISLTGLTNGQSYNYYVRCQDAAGNANPNDYSITFSVASQQQPSATLFQEDFENGNFASKGWYDATNAPTTTTEHISGSTASGQYRWRVGQTTPDTTTTTGGLLSMRHKFTPSNSVYVSYWVKYSSNYVGSGVSYHPHEFLLLTNADVDYAGPAYTHMTGYIEHNHRTIGSATGGMPIVALQDGANIDETRIGSNLIGITENRSIGGCNGNPANDGHIYVDCYSVSPTTHWNGAQWYPPGVYFDNNPSSPNYKNNWHHVEAYFQLNTISNSIANQDGMLKYWFDGQLIINTQNVYLRTGSYPAMQFNQFIIAPYIGVGSPADQSMWIDNLTVATAPPSAAPADTTAPIISSVSSSSLTSSGATITWTTNENSDTQIEYGLTTSYGSSTALNISMTTSHLQMLTGLSTNTLYHYRVKSTDAAGNLATSGDFTFTTLSLQGQMLFQTTFPDSDCAAWVQSATGEYAPNDPCQPNDSITQWGSWTTALGGRSSITASANNPLGTGKGFRLLRGDGHTNNGAALRIVLPPTRELWMRFYMRYQQGFAWLTPGQPGFTKDIYMNEGHTTGNFVLGYGVSSDGWGLAMVSPGTGNYRAQPGWKAVNNGLVGDGLFHCYEAHVKWDTNGADGIAESWVDGTAAHLIYNHNFGTTGNWDMFLLGENSHWPNNIIDMYTDYDDVAVSTTGRIGCLYSDTTPPTITSIVSSSITQNSATITWTTNENSDTQIEYGLTTSYGSSTTLNSAMVTSHSQSLTGLQANTLYHYRVKSTDAAGNLATSGDFTFMTSAPPATTAWQTTFNCADWIQPPIGTAITTQIVCDNLTQWGDWATAAGSKGQITVAANYPGGGGGKGQRHWRGSGSNGVNDNSGGLKFSFANVGLPPTVPEFWMRWYMRYQPGFQWAGTGPIYTKEFYCFGPGGASGPDSNTGMISSDSWTVEVYKNSHRDNSPNGFGWASKFSDGNWHEAQIHYKAGTGNGVVQVWIDGTLATSVTNEDFGTGGWDSCILGSNARTVQAGQPDMYVDYDDWTVSTNGYISSIGSPPPDTTPPAISFISSSSITSSGATISWTTNENSDTQVEYGTTASYGSSTTLITSMLTSHSQSLSGLAANTLYHYRVKSKDAAGNLATSGDFTLTTSAPPPSTIFQTTFTTTQGWTTDKIQVGSGSSLCGTGFSNIQTGVGDYGGWKSANGNCDTITTLANNPLGGTGRGFRHWRGDGHNNGGGGLGITPPSAQSEVWMRYYARYMSGFNWINGQPNYVKDIYWNPGTPNFVITGFTGGTLYTHVVRNTANTNVLSSDTWSAINGGSLGDGLYHCYEQHFKIDTNGGNGILEMWRDGNQVLSRSNINFAAATFDFFILGSNQAEVDNDQDGIGNGDETGAADGYTDYDDVAISTSGRIGCL